GCATILLRDCDHGPTGDPLLQHHVVVAVTFAHAAVLPGALRRRSYHGALPRASAPAGEVRRRAVDSERGSSVEACAEAARAGPVHRRAYDGASSHEPQPGGPGDMKVRGSNDTLGRLRRCTGAISGPNTGHKSKRLASRPSDVPAGRPRPAAGHRRSA